MLGSGGSLVASAIGEGQIPNFSNSAWSKSESMAIGGNGAYIFCSGKYQTGGTAFLTLDLQPGERYKMSGRLGLSGTATSPQYVMSLTLANGEEVAVFDTTSKGSKNIDIEFVVPGNSGKVDLGIFLKPNSTIDYSSNWKIENTSTDKGILDSIKEGFSKLWEWLQGIWDSIKEIPTKIGQFITTLGDRIRDFFSNLGDRIGNFFTDLWERIKAFFLPSDGFFDTYSASFKQFVSDHFGFLYDFSQELSTLFNTIVDFEPASPPYIDFPEIKVPMPGKTYTILEKQHYTFDFLGNQPWSTLYSAYQAFVWLAYCLMLINLIRRKYAVVFGGSANAD